jgi:hypothetical protein
VEEMNKAANLSAEAEMQRDDLLCKIHMIIHMQTTEKKTRQRTRGTEEKRGTQRHERTHRMRIWLISMPPRTS